MCNERKGLMQDSAEPMGRASLEERLLEELRDARKARRSGSPTPIPATLGQRIADRVAETMGSWTFIIIQTIILIIWIALNVAGFVQKWDHYPFILLNLGLSFQAAYAAPFIMMSQNRQQDIDRCEAENDYEINVKAELEIKLLHKKIDEMRHKEIALLTQAVADLTLLRLPIPRCPNRTVASRSSRHGHLGSGLSAKSPVPNEICSVMGSLGGGKFCPAV
jgi:uncharacterized membrane protein